MTLKKAAKQKEEEMNHWGKLGTWNFHVCKDPQMLEREKKRG